MGIFDYLHTTKVQSVPDRIWQTKSMDGPSLDMFELGADGILQRRVWAKGVPVSDRVLVPCDYTGELYFYNFKYPERPIDQGGWLAYKALFVHGRQDGPAELMEDRDGPRVPLTASADDC